jgi:hypothetical protein
MTGGVFKGYGSVTAIDREALAYAAGVFDGEGNVRSFPNGQNGVGIHVQVAQGHPQMMERFKAAVGTGKVYGPKPWSSKNPKPSWWFGAYSRNAVHRICWMLWPWLSDPKRQQFHSAFERYHALQATRRAGRERM